ncbi:MAG TPA: cupin domain-containing protein [Beijerinckiaceae bacterium]|nr:cupin domain-containing protein [Beijerinckiaceae bacterium]
MQNRDLDAFDAKLARSHLRGQWKSEDFLTRAIGGPKPAGVPALWSWRDVTALLEEAASVMPESLQARRSLIFQNPELPRGTTQTMNMGIQMIMPGETAWAHRHSIAALRFVIEGSPSLTTIVDGATCPMETFDLVLTPNWYWHDHHSHAQKPVYWLDVLDVPLVLGLNQTFYEPGSGENQPAPEASLSNRRHLHYPWRDVEAALAEITTTAEDGRIYEYRDPKTGAPTLPTLGCKAQCLPPGFATEFRQRTSSAVYFVVRGEGTTEAGGHELQWRQNDSFVVPNWMRHRHINRSPKEDAVLFSVEDAPALRALGLYREA